MGREVRRVSADWQHPTDGRGNFIALHGHSFREDAARWDEGAAQWERGFRRDHGTNGWKPKGQDETGTFAEWDGERPREEEYMPDWPEAERTHLQMYEDTSEGTPISPVMESPEALAQWLADNKASAFGDMTATYDQWLATIRRGWAVGAVWSPGKGFESGVAHSEEVQAHD